MRQPPNRLQVTCINEEVRRLGAAALMNERCLDLQQVGGPAIA